MKGGGSKADVRKADNRLSVKRMVMKGIKDPNKPKRPPGSFFIFMEGFRKQYQEKHPNSISVAAVGKAAGEKWKSMSEEEKAPFVAKAVKQRKEYELKMGVYNKSLADESDKSESEVSDEGDEDEESDTEPPEPEMLQFPAVQVGSSDSPTVAQSPSTPGRSSQGPSGSSVTACSIANRLQQLFQRDLQSLTPEELREIQGHLSQVQKFRASSLAAAEAEKLLLLLQQTIKVEIKLETWLSRLQESREKLSLHSKLEADQAMLLADLTAQDKAFSDLVTESTREADRVQKLNETIKKAQAERDTILQRRPELQRKREEISSRRAELQRKINNLTEQVSQVSQQQLYNKIKFETAENALSKQPARWKESQRIWASLKDALSPKVEMI